MTYFFFFLAFFAVVFFAAFFAFLAMSPPSICGKMNQSIARTRIGTRKKKCNTELQD